MPVAVPMMQVRVVGMPVHQWCMAMPMRVRLAGRVGRQMIVLMMSIVAMAMLVFHSFMNVLMLMPFCQMQPEAEAHQASSDQKLNRQQLIQHNDRHDGTHERCE
jgi:hypothetical protein